MTVVKKKRKGKTTTEIRDTVTSRVIEALEGGTVPWQRPWRVVGGTHKNWASKKAYRGINQILLDLTAQSGGYKSPHWLTFKQAAAESYKQYRKAHGLKDNEETAAAYRESGEYKGIQKGEKSTLVIFFKVIRKEEEDKNGEKVVIGIPLLKYFNVWNSEQTGLDLPLPDEGEEREHTPIEAAESIIEGYKGCPPITHGGDRACYIPSLDQISLPDAEQFRSDEDYYDTLFHEAVHSTGHDSRIGRGLDGTFGSDPYAKEELVAELGGAILSGYAGIDTEGLHDNTAAYIKSWISRFKDDNALLISAGAAAQKAADHILDTVFEDKK